MSDYQQIQEPRKTKRSNLLFGCIGVALVVMVLGAGGLWWWFSSAFTTDPAAVAALTEEIVPGAQMPDGYRGQVGIDMFGYKMVLITSGMEEGPGGTGEGRGDASVIMVATTSAGGEDAMEKSMREKLAEQTGEGDRQIEDLGTEAITVGGVETQFTKSRITDKDKGTDFVQYVGILPAGDGRSTMIMIMGPADKFDRKGMDAFLGSIAPAGDAPSTGPRKR